MQNGSDASKRMMHQGNRKLLCDRGCFEMVGQMARVSEQFPHKEDYVLCNNF